MLLILFIGGDKLLGHHKLRLSLGPVLNASMRLSELRNHTAVWHMAELSTFVW